MNHLMRNENFPCERDIILKFSEIKKKYFLCGHAHVHTYTHTEIIHCCSYLILELINSVVCLLSML